MILLASTLYDPGTAVSKATDTLIAMTAFDTTNLRIAVTVPSHGKVWFKIRCCVYGQTSYPSLLLGVMNGSTVVARSVPSYFVGTSSAGTSYNGCVAEFTVSGLTPGSTNFDAAYSVKATVAGTNIKYGGPDNTTIISAWGGFLFEAWDPAPSSGGGSPAFRGVG